MVEDEAVMTNGNPPSASLSRTPYISADTTWVQEGVQVAGGKRWGNDLKHLNFPAGIWVDDDETLYIADYSNNRIVEWKSGAKSGEVIAGEGQKNDRSERLRNPVDLIYEKDDDSFIIADEGNRRVVRWPRQADLNIQILAANIDPWGIAVDHLGYLYVCDHKKHEVKRWKLGEPIGTVVAGGNGKGARLKQLSHPTYICVDQDQSVYISDWGNHRVVKWEKDAKKGILVVGGQEQRTFPLKLDDPFGLMLDQEGNLFVADWKQHRIVRYAKGAIHSTVVVGNNGNGRESNQFSHPMSFGFDSHNNLYVTDYSNNRVQKFYTQSNALTQKPAIEEKKDEDEDRKEEYNFI